MSQPSLRSAEEKRECDLLPSSFLTAPLPTSHLLTCLGCGGESEALGLMLPATSWWRIGWRSVGRRQEQAWLKLCHSLARAVDWVQEGKWAAPQEKRGQNRFTWFPFWARLGVWELQLDMGAPVVGQAGAASCTGKLQSVLNYCILYRKIGDDGILRTLRG